MAGPNNETFTEARALAFKADVEEAGHRWPTDRNGVKWVRGEGYVSPAAEDAIATPT